MRFKTFSSVAVAGVLGFLLGGVILYANTLPDLLPYKRILDYIFALDFVRSLVRSSSPEVAEIGITLTVHLVNSFPFNVFCGLCAGLLLHRFTFPRVFSYSTLGALIISALFYIFIAFRVVDLNVLDIPIMRGLHKLFLQTFQIMLINYALFFVGLYCGSTALTQLQRLRARTLSY